MKIHIVFFSATYTTRTVCRGIARHLGDDFVEHDLTNHAPENEILLGPDELMVVGMPVYCGRIPEMGAERLRMFRGQCTRTITLAVYGNRDYDDALLELTQLVEGNGFRAIAAAAFIGCHCIFPAVAAHRPDADDLKKMADFAELCQPLLQKEIATLGSIHVPGNPEYRPLKRVPYHPEANDNCINCGTCAALCPTGAISLTDAHQVNVDLCISCGRCVQVCTQNGRQFAGEVYAATAVKFAAACSARKEPEFFFCPVL